MIKIILYVCVVLCMTYFGYLLSRKFRYAKDFWQDFCVFNRCFLDNLGYSRIPLDSLINNFLETNKGKSYMIKSYSFEEKDLNHHFYNKENANNLKNEDDYNEDENEEQIKLKEQMTFFDSDISSKLNNLDKECSNQKDDNKNYSINRYNISNKSNSSSSALLNNKDLVLNSKEKIEKECYDKKMNSKENEKAKEEKNENDKISFFKSVFGFEKGEWGKHKKNNSIDNNSDNKLESNKFLENKNNDKYLNTKFKNEKKIFPNKRIDSNYKLNNSNCDADINHNKYDKNNIYVNYNKSNSNENSNYDYYNSSKNTNLNSNKANILENENDIDLHNITKKNKNQNEKLNKDFEDSFEKSSHSFDEEEKKNRFSIFPFLKKRNEDFYRILFSFSKNHSGSFLPNLEYLTNDEKRFLREYFSLLGKSDSESQKAYFTSVGLTLDKKSVTASENCKKNVQLYIKLGFLLGLAIDILLA